jgi:hypothetical protein
MGEDQLMGITSVLGSSALLPAGLGFRNKIINGGFDIWQRGTSFSAAGYTADRWAIVAASGQTVSVTQQAFTPGNTIIGQEPTFYARMAWSGTPSGTFWFTQRVEDVRTFAGQQVVLSFWAKASSPTSVFAPTIEQNFGTGGSSVVTTTASAIALTSSWQKFSVIFNIPSISGKTIGTNSYLDVRPLNGGSTVNGINIDIWGVQVEQNYQPTPFEQRPFAVELQLCQRYYEKSYDIGTAPGTATDSGFVLAMPGGAQASSSGIHDAYINFKVTKRTAASMTIYDNAGNINKCRRTAVGSANYDNQSVQDVNGYTNGCYFRSGSGSASTHTVSCHYVASAEF